MSTIRLVNNLTNSILMSNRRLARWRPTLAIWGIGAAGAVSLLMSDVPLYQRDVLKKIPLVASYFEGEFFIWPIMQGDILLPKCYSSAPLVVLLSVDRMRLTFSADKTPASDKPF